MTHQNKLADEAAREREWKAMEKINEDLERRREVDPTGILTDAEWAAIRKSGCIKEKEKIPDNFIDDEELLAILFCDSDYQDRLHAVQPHQGFIIGEIIEEAREELKDFLAFPDARDLFELPPRST